jgi:hypothetical protein
MRVDRLEYFEPYDIPPHHENALTRAYLTLLRLSPHALGSFLEELNAARVASGISIPFPGLTDLRGPPAIRTQVGRGLGRDEGRLVSIVITGEPWKGHGEVVASERSYVYDGVIELDDWILIIENKPWTDVRADQLNPGLPRDTDLEIVPRPLTVTWRDLMARLDRLSESGLPSRTEALLIDDFRDYVERHFPSLNPFGTLRACRSHLGRIQRRCNQILEEIALEHEVLTMGSRREGMADPLQLPNGPAALVFLKPLQDAGGGEILTVELRLWPGDTMRQARSLHSALDRNALSSLEASDWTVEPNPHFAFMASNYCWWRSDLSLDEYLRYWSDDLTRIRQLRRGEDDFASELEPLLTDGMLTEEELGCFRKHFIDTRRATANLCPGLHLAKVWRLEEAEALDDEGRLGSAVLDQLKMALACWGQEISIPGG